MPRSVLIVTGESSGELYGSMLATQIKTNWPDIDVIGVGGDRMRKAGVRIISGIASAFGLIEALSAYSKVKETYRHTIDALKREKPGVVVLIDYPDFNFKVGIAAKKLGIKVLYYVSPQVWAWRKGRISKMAEFVDQMAVVLPFEEDVYANSGIPCEFVGHPVVDDMADLPTDKKSAKEALGLDGGTKYITLMPGSRPSELDRLLPLIFEVAAMIKEQLPEYRMLLPLAPNIDMNKYADLFDGVRLSGVQLLKSNAVLALGASEAAVIASGTSTLQATLLGVPMVVIYKVFPLTYYIGRMILDVDYITLTNLLLGREAVPELIQKRANRDEIMNNLRLLLIDGKKREDVLDDLERVQAMFAGKSASRRVAQMVGELGGYNA